MILYVTTLSRKATELHCLLTWLQTLDTGFYCTGINALVPRCDKCLNVSGDHVVVCCVPRVHRSQSDVLGIWVFVSLYMKHCEYVRLFNANAVYCVCLLNYTVTLLWNIERNRMSKLLDFQFMRLRACLSKHAGVVQFSAYVALCSLTCMMLLRGDQSGT